jgi:hypothetical protein
MMTANSVCIKHANPGKTQRVFRKQASAQTGIHITI